MEALETLKMDLPHDPIMLLLSVHWKEMKLVHKRFLCTHFCCNTVNNSNRFSLGSYQQKNIVYVQNGV